MGIDFRGSAYVRRVRLGKRTVKEGEAVAIWDRYGRHRQVVGPALCRLYYSTIRFLNRHVAEGSEYLRVRHRDGTIEHIKGPVVLFENPVYHTSISVEKAIHLPTASDYMVVLHGASTKEGTSAPSRQIRAGPLTVIPAADEVVHTFEWKDQGDGLLSDKQRVVHIGKTMAREVKCKVQGADGHGAVVCVALRVQLVGISEALGVQDPVCECDSATEAAVLAAVQGIRFGDVHGSLLQHVRTACAEGGFHTALALELKQRAACALVSLAVNAVEPSDSLKRLLSKEDDVAAARVRDQVADAALAAAAARQQQEQALELAKQKHELQLAASRHRAELELHDAEAARHLANLKELKGLGVDLTEYLVHGPRSRLAAGAGAQLTATEAPARAKPMSFLCL